MARQIIVLQAELKEKESKLKHLSSKQSSSNLVVDNNISATTNSNNSAYDNRYTRQPRSSNYRNYVNPHKRKFGDDRYDNRHHQYRQIYKNNNSFIPNRRMVNDRDA